MKEPITPEDLPKWVPGRITCASDNLDWKGVFMRAYDYKGQDVKIPPMRDFMIVAYKQGETYMQRRFDGAWTKTNCGPGSVSLLTRSQASHWQWPEDIEVNHIYLEETLLSGLAREALGREVAEVKLRDLLNIEDETLTAGVAAIRREIENPGLGGALYVEAVAHQIGLHLLRNYASIEVTAEPDESKLDPRQQRRVLEHIDAHLHTVSLESMAQSIGLGVWSFSRRFRETIGRSPYAFVLDRRVEHARRYLAESAKPIKEIAALCGFSDQAHLTRTFRARLACTPARYRNDAAR